MDVKTPSDKEFWLFIAVLVIILLVVLYFI
jgi:hypothetical protein